VKLIAVTDDRLSIHKLVEELLAIEPYIDAVILREKSKTDREVCELIQELKLGGFDQTKIIVHGHADLASLTNIHKVQLPGHGLPLPLLKDHFPALSFGKSVHSYEEAKTAMSEGADWVLYGHLYETGSKALLPPRGTDELNKIISALAIPVYAIGGIKPSHIESLDVAGVAVMSSIFGSDSPITAAKSYYDAIKGGIFYDDYN
jgi:thiazole tautomerase (transcriptional regulator TenI)